MGQKHAQKKGGQRRNKKAYGPKFDQDRWDKGVEMIGGPDMVRELIAAGFVRQDNLAGSQAKLHDVAPYGERPSAWVTIHQGDEALKFQLRDNERTIEVPEGHREGVVVWDPGVGDEGDYVPIPEDGVVEFAAARYECILNDGKMTRVHVGTGRFAPIYSDGYDCFVIWVRRGRGQRVWREGYAFPLNPADLEIMAFDDDDVEDPNGTPEWEPLPKTGFTTEILLAFYVQSWEKRRGGESEVELQTVGFHPSGKIVKGMKGYRLTADGTPQHVVLHERVWGFVAVPVPSGASRREIMNLAAASATQMVTQEQLEPGDDEFVTGGKLVNLWEFLEGFQYTPKGADRDDNDALVCITPEIKPEDFSWARRQLKARYKPDAVARRHESQHGRRMRPRQLTTAHTTFTQLGHALTRLEELLATQAPQLQEGEQPTEAPAEEEKPARKRRTRRRKTTKKTVAAVEEGAEASAE